MTTLKNILIVSPSADKDATYLPYIWAILKTFSENDYKNAELVKKNYNWIDPIVNNLNITQYKEIIDKIDTIDVLGLSIYSWNHKSCEEIAQYVKNKFPNCLIVARWSRIRLENW